MALLEELGKTLSDKGKEAARKAKDLSQLLQLKSQLTGEKAKLDEVYARIGRIYYDEHLEGEARFADEFAAIKSGRARVSELELEICRLEGNRACAECGARVDREARYCSRCGAPMPLTPVVTESTVPDELFEVEDLDYMDDGE